MSKTTKKKAAPKAAKTVEPVAPVEAASEYVPVRKLRYGYHAIPPGGWWFLEKRTGLRVEAETFHGLVDQVIEHRKYKELEPTDHAEVWREVEQAICERVPEPYWREQ